MEYEKLNARISVSGMQFGLWHLTNGPNSLSKLKPTDNKVFSKAVIGIVVFEVAEMLKPDES